MAIGSQITKRMSLLALVPFGLMLIPSALAQTPNTAPASQSKLPRQQACEEGDASSCGWLADDLVAGRLGAPDNARARIFYEKGCTLLSVHSCLILGHMHRQGRGGEKSDPLAAKAYAQACKLDDRIGCINYAEMLQTGQGVARNEALIYAALQKACRLAQSDAVEVCIARPPGLLTTAQREKERAYIQTNIQNGMRLWKEAKDYLAQGRSCSVHSKVHSKVTTAKFNFKRAITVLERYPGEAVYEKALADMKRMSDATDTALEGLKTWNC